MLNIQPIEITSTPIFVPVNYLTFCTVNSVKIKI